MKGTWDERYAQEAYAYGEQPNHYLKEKLSPLPVGTILFPADGEGRNSVYAATLGWSVYAFDQSGEGKKKALHLAEKKHVEITYEVGEFETTTYAPNQFDAIALIYAHFPAAKKSAYHKKLATYLRPGGSIIFEAFSKHHLDYVSKNEKVGGPRDIDILFSTEEIQNDFSDFEILQLEELAVELNEGLYHIGTGSVIRFTGRKK